MNAHEKSPSGDADPALIPPTTIGTGLLCWALISFGFVGLRMLMQERPEFIGAPTGGSKVEMVQESPWVVTRKLNDDVSAIKPMQPEMSDVRFDMAGRRDYRGLRTVMDMSGEFHGRYLLTNAAEEPVFVLFKCPHPRGANAGSGNVPAGGLKLQSSVTGVQENAGDAWIWSGTLAAHGNVNLEVSYQVASLKGLTYRVGEQNGNPVRQLRVTIQRQDLDSMRFESGDGRKASAGGTVTWERKEFLAPDTFSATIEETRNLHASLLQLVEIGPLVCLLFLLAVSAVIVARQEFTTVQMLTISACYALYYPLIIYLSARFSFSVALVIASVVPGTLLLNYARWLLGTRLGLLGGFVLLALYWVFPTLAAFAGWNRGMMLLCLGVVTLWVLINLQNQALRRKAAAVATAAALFLLTAFPCGAGAGDIQILVPGDLAARAVEAKREPVAPIVSFEPIQYQVREESNFFRVEAQAPFRVLRAGDSAMPLFFMPVYLVEGRVESVETNFGAIVMSTNVPALFLQRAGAANLRLIYRVPIANREGNRRASIPLVAGVAGGVKLQSAHGDLGILTGSLWTRKAAGKGTEYEIGVAGEDSLAVEWQGQGAGTPAAATRAVEVAKEFYGIGVTRAQNLTVVNSDGSCTHFAEFELPAFQTEEFRLKLPSNARLISVSVNGNEISSPAVEEQICRVRLPGREAQQTAHRVSFRIAYPALRLGFMGTAELALPEVFQTVGTLEWVVALPAGFQAQVLSSGLEVQRTAPDLGRFGDYGRALKSHGQTYLSKDLAPPGPVGLSLKYRQFVPGISETR